MPQEPTGAKRPVEPAQDDVEKFLAEQKQLEAHRHDLIKDLLRQKEAAIKVFDEKLAKLGYDGEHANKRSHHKDDAGKKPE
ncbi:MAG: hypothetical protein ABI759_19330 [Candidatus Solibacter sp.]